METKCPICNRIISEDYNYCPSCGLPKRITSKRRWDLKPTESSSNLLVHARSKFSYSNKIFDYQKCNICDSPNPFGARYCRACGARIELQAKDKYGHGWVDLGLSVLWSTETIEGLYLWNHSQIELSTHSDMSDYFRIDIENKDIATTKWGAKWRTPTKEEFEELVTKCKWEKCLDSISKKHALKAIGPNGNYIIITVTGHAGCSCSHSLISNYEPENIYSECAFWTSSEVQNKARTAYDFRFMGYDGFARTLTIRERKELELKTMRPFKIVKPSIYDDDFDLYCKQEKLRKEEERKILQAIGDDSKEKEENLKKDRERRNALWLETPIKFIYGMEDCQENTICRQSKRRGYAIRPVADKKWQGEL